MASSKIPISTAQPVDLTKFIGKARERIYRLGIELEGGWRTLPKGVTLTHDGSVAITPASNLSAEEEARFQVLNRQYRDGIIAKTLVNEFQSLYSKRGKEISKGELPSPPLEKDVFADWMKIHYPTHVNASCGMHVHMSFKSATTYQRLMVPEYQATVVEYIKRWATKEGLSPDHPIWPRLAGKSAYCQHLFDADRQARNAGPKGHDQRAPGHRYTVINYCYARLKTIECRLLPMMDKVEMSIRAIEELLKITNGFLLATTEKPSVEKKREIKTAHVIVDGNGMRNEIQEWLV